MNDDIQVPQQPMRAPKIIRVTLEWNTQTGALNMTWPAPLKGIVLKILATAMNSVIDYKPKPPAAPSILTPAGPSNGQH